MALGWNSAKVLACLAAVLAGGAVAGSPGPALRGAESANGTAAGAPEIEAQPEMSVADPVVSELDVSALAEFKPDFEERDDSTEEPDDGEEDMVDEEPDFDLGEDTTEEPYDGEEDMVDDEADFDLGDDATGEPYDGEDGMVDSAAESGMPPRLPGMPLPGGAGGYPLPGGAGGAPGGFPLPREGLPPITGCWGPNATATCPAGYSCVVKYDGTFSQCMDCSAWSFAKSCQKLDDYMRYSAVQTCKRSCLNTKCYNSAWCKRPHKCIKDPKSNWGQCIACKSKKFWKASCYAVPRGLLRRAQHKCHKHCKGYHGFHGR